MNIVKEHFKSIDEMIRTIESRPNNKIMRNEDSSRSNDYEFTKTHSYDEAKKLYQFGYKKFYRKLNVRSEDKQVKCRSSIDVK